MTDMLSCRHMLILHKERNFQNRKLNETYNQKNHSKSFGEIMPEIIGNF
jgi:hypothetical protein